MKMAILALGSIAHAMAQTMQMMASEGVECYAVGCRDLGRAEAFAQQWGFEKAYGSYAELVSDPAVELVYIASPHSHHYEHVKLCLAHGKHVLCEKAFTANAMQAKELFAMAKEKNLLLTEAIWPRYMPSRKMMEAVITSGVIGDVCTITASMCHPIQHVPRIMELALAGGALLDIGIYPITFTSMIMGDTKIKSITTSAVLAETGVDLRNSTTFTYENGVQAVLISDATTRSDCYGIVHGTKGYMVVKGINNCDVLRVYDLEDNLIAEHPVPKKLTGYEYEVRSCMCAMQQNACECPEMPHEESIKIMELMDSLRKEWGVVYACDAQ